MAKITVISTSTTSGSTPYTLRVDDWFIQTDDDTVIRCDTAAYTIQTNGAAGDVPFLEIREGKTQGLFGVQITGNDEARIGVGSDGRIDGWQTAILAAESQSIDGVTITNEGLINGNRPDVELHTR